MSTHQLDVAALHGALERQLAYCGMSWRQLATETGVHNSAFNYMKHGGAPNAHTLVTLLAWLGCDASLDSLIQYPLDTP